MEKVESHPVPQEKRSRKRSNTVIFSCVHSLASYSHSMPSLVFVVATGTSTTVGMNDEDVIGLAREIGGGASVDVWA